MSTRTVSNHRAAKTTRLAKSPPSHASVAALNPKPMLPVKSRLKAAKAFKNFSLSKFPNGSTPANFVPRAKIKDPVAVQAVQRKVIAQQITAQRSADPVNAGMTLALPKAMMAQLLPSFKNGKIDLDELLGLMTQRMRGTEFYANGNPTIARLAQQSQQQSQVQAIIDAIKQGGKK